MQGYGAMSLTEFASPVIAQNAEATLRHVLENGVTVINTAGVLGRMRCFQRRIFGAQNKMNSLH